GGPGPVTSRLPSQARETGWKETSPMGRSSREGRPQARPTWEPLETWVRGKVQEFVQELLEVEVTELLGRRRHERRAGIDAPVGYRNGYGEPGRVAGEGG